MEPNQFEWIKVGIVATTKSTFAGAATIKCRFLDYLHSLGCNISLVVEDVPPAYKSLNSQYRLCLINISKAKSASQGAKELLYNYLVEEIVNESRKCFAENRSVIIWGSHMFPYGCACLKAKEILMEEGIPSSLILFPVGADVWEIGKDTPSALKNLLDSNDVNVLATYSQKFAEEIRAYMHTDKPIECISPFVDESLFRKFSVDERNIRRKQLGLKSDSLVFINHSNMRPVKRIDFTISLVEKIAMTRSSQQCHLLLIGPLSENLPVAAQGLTIHHIDTVENVADYLPAADFCINTSLHDSFNTALLESMACGVPVITSDRPAIAETIYRNNAGLVYKTIEPSSDLQAEIYGEYPIEENSCVKLIETFTNLTDADIETMQEKAYLAFYENHSIKNGTGYLRNLIYAAMAK